MAVMKGMRDIIKPVMWIVVIAFVGTIVFVWGGDLTKSKYKKGIIGVVNGQEISAEIFSRVYYGQLKQLEGEYEELDEQTTNQVVNNTWDNLVNQILLNQQIEKLDINVSDREFFEFMRGVPLVELQQYPTFQTDEKFDYQKYLQALNDPRFPWGQIINEEYIKLNLKTLKLQEMITDLVRVTEPEAKQEYINDNQKVKVNYIFLANGDFLKQVSQITQQEIEEYYEQNQDEFKVDQKVKLDYVAIPKQPSGDDVEKIKSDLLKIKMEAQQGEDFGVLAGDYSEDRTTAEQGGDLGWLAKGKMIEPFEKTIPSLKVGEISEPIKTQYGWHLIKLLGKKRSNNQQEFHISQILLKITPSEYTLDSLKTFAEDLAEEADEIGLKEVAEEDSLNLPSTGFFFKDDIIPGLGYNPEANSFAFENKVGKVSQPIETNDNFIVVEIQDKKPAGISSLEEAREEIKRKITLEKAGDLALGKAEEVYQQAGKSKSLGKAAKKFNQKIRNLEFTRNSYLIEVGNDPQFIGIAFSLNTKNKLSQPTKAESGVYLIELVSLTAVNWKQYTQNKDSLYQELLIEKKTQAYLDWFEGIKQKAKIEDYRSKFYRMGGS